MVTATPVQVDPSAHSSGLRGTALCSEGPYQTAGGALYIVLQTQDGSGLLVVFKSVDNGLTFVQKDIANSLATAGAQFYCQFDGSVIRIAYESAALTIRWAKFDTATDTFTDAIFPNINPARLTAGNAFNFVLRSDASVLCLMQTAAGNVGFRVNVAGVWSAFTALANTALHSYTPEQCLLDPATQISHIVYGDLTGGVNTWTYIQVDSTNTPNIAAVIAVATASDLFNLGQINAGTLYLPLSRGAGNSKASIISGTPLAAPVWTVTDLDVQLTNNITSVGFTVQNAVPTVLWAFENNAGTINGIRKSILVGGVWQPLSSYYDVITNPPNAVPLNQQFVSEVVPFVLANGNLVTAATMLDLTFAFAAFFMSEPGAVVPVVGPGTIRLVSPLPVHLPDPRIHCAGSFQKRCVTADGRNILLTKGTTGFYS